jgi:hypothetical protein
MEHGVPQRLGAQPNRIPQLVGMDRLPPSPVREQDRRCDQGQAEQGERYLRAIQARARDATGF